MVTIHYFASVREKLGFASEQIELPEQVTTVATLVDFLVEQHGASWKEVMTKASVLVAINQAVAKFDSSVQDTDEIAFFPPVTGG